MSGGYWYNFGTLRGHATATQTKPGRGATRPYPALFQSIAAYLQHKASADVGVPRQVQVLVG
jgi:hypothetical protein